jgi:hypothetical protein
MSAIVHCDLCGVAIAPSAHYIVRIDVFADPTIPDMSTEEVNDLTSEDQLAELMRELKAVSEDELQDQVHRRFEYKLCGPCQRKFLANPLGRPRSSPMVHQQQGRN